MLMPRDWMDRVFDAYGDSVELLGHFTDRLQRLGHNVTEKQRPRLERLREEARQLLAPHQWDKEEHARPALRALHHEIALLEAGVTARRFRHLADGRSFEAAAECLLETEQIVQAAEKVLGGDHPEVQHARAEFRRILDETFHEVRALRDGATWLMECIERYREEGVTGEWPPYPGREEELVTMEDVDGM
ncbi:MAG: hypothetical protein PVF51_02855 [Nitrospirota bacterium]|jgi:hypothetical protein